MSFANRLRELRDQVGMSRQQLADASGIGRTTIRDYEQGKRQPLLESAFKLAAGLGVKVTAFEETPTRATKKTRATKGTKTTKKEQHQ